MGFYHSCQAIGNMLSGALQAAISMFALILIIIERDKG